MLPQPIRSSQRLRRCYCSVRKCMFSRRTLSALFCLRKSVCNCISALFRNGHFVRSCAPFGAWTVSTVLLAADLLAVFMCFALDCFWCGSGSFGRRLWGLFLCHFAFELLLMGSRALPAPARGRDPLTPITDGFADIARTHKGTWMLEKHPPLWPHTFHIRYRLW